MKEHISGIVLGTVRHSDRHNVTNIFTRERGRMAFLSPAGSSKSSRQTAARLQPLSIIEAEANISSTRDLHILSAILPIKVWKNLYYDPFKGAVVMFLSEFLTKLLREAPSEPMLWDFIANSLSILDATDNRMASANFHIAFLVSLSYMMGIQPDVSEYKDGMEFDMKSGTMVYPFSAISTNGIRLDAIKTSFLPSLLRINFANARFFRFSGKERSELIDHILKYYGLHFPGSDNLKSLEIMKEIFT